MAKVETRGRNHIPVEEKMVNLNLTVKPGIHAGTKKLKELGKFDHNEAYSNLILQKLRETGTPECLRLLPETKQFNPADFPGQEVSPSINSKDYAVTYSRFPDSSLMKDPHKFYSPDIRNEELKKKVTAFCENEPAFAGTDWAVANYPENFQPFAYSVVPEDWSVVEGELLFRWKTKYQIVDTRATTERKRLEFQEGENQRLAERNRIIAEQERITKLGVQLTKERGEREAKELIEKEKSQEEIQQQEIMDNLKRCEAEKLNSKVSVPEE